MRDRWMSPKLSGVSILAATLLIGACTPAAPAAPTAAPAAPAAAPAKPAAPAAEPAKAAAPAQPKSTDPLIEAQSLSMDALYEKAKQEGGTVVYYGESNMPTIRPFFEARFPGIKIEHVDAAGDQMVARAVAEARGGKVVADAWQSGLREILNMREQDLLADFNPPEAAGHPDTLKGSYWVANDLLFYSVIWNTTLVSPADEPKSFEDLGDPKWKGKLIGEPRNWHMLEAFAKYKFKDEQKALDMIKKIAANEVRFMNGHPLLFDTVASGAAPMCWTCNNQHLPPGVQKGAPVKLMLSESVGVARGQAIMKGAPHPYAGMLIARWLIGEDGQKVLADIGRINAHPKVAVKANIVPEKQYLLQPDDYKETDKYTRLWNEAFGLR